MIPSFVHARRAAGPRRRVGRRTSRERSQRPSALGRAPRARPRTRAGPHRPVGALLEARHRGRPARRAPVRGHRRRPRGEEIGGHRAAAGRARSTAGELVGRARQPPPPPGPRLRGAALPLRDRLRLRRVPRPPAPPHAHRPVAAADAGSRRRDPRGGRRGRLRRRLRARARRSRAEYERLREAGHAEAAPYALCLGYRIRYILDINAREAMHLSELRSAREGHPSYRAVAQSMHAAIAERPPCRRRRR